MNTGWTRESILNVLVTAQSCEPRRLAGELRSFALFYQSPSGPQLAMILCDDFAAVHPELPTRLRHAYTYWTNVNASGVAWDKVLRCHIAELTHPDTWVDTAGTVHPVAELLDLGTGSDQSIVYLNALTYRRTVPVAPVCTLSKSVLSDVLDVQCRYLAVPATELDRRYPA